MNKSKSYKTDHPTIKEISIGDKFVLNNGTTVTFVKYRKNLVYPFKMNNKLCYTKDLKYFPLSEYNNLNIKQRYIPLKDKINLI